MSENKISMFETAHNRTVESVKYLIYQEKVKTDELNQLASDILNNAKMELYIAGIEGVSAENLSKPASLLLENPELAINNEFRAHLFLDEKGTEHKVFKDPFEGTTAATSPTEVTIEDTPIEEGVPGPKQEEGPTTVVTPKQEKKLPKAIIKKFEKCEPGRLPASASKKYKATTLKPCRELLRDIVENYCTTQLEYLTCADNSSIEQKMIAKERLATSSIVSAIMATITTGTSVSDYDEIALTDELLLVDAIENLAYTIIDNVAVFMQDNPELVTGKNVTATNINKYYRALGADKLNADTKHAADAGKNVVIDALTPTVFEILDNSASQSR